MVVAQDIADKLRGIRQIEFLVDLNFDGWHKRLSVNKDIYVPNSSGSDLLFQGLIKDNLRIFSSFSFRDLRSSLLAVSIVMNNKYRFQDEEAARTLDGREGSVYVWSQELDWSEISPFPIFKGVFKKESHNSKEYRFRLEGSEAESIETIPTCSINDDTFSEHKKSSSGVGSVSGKAVPLIFGDFSTGNRVAALPVKTAGAGFFDWHLVSHRATYATDSHYSTQELNVFTATGARISNGDYTYKNDVSFTTADGSSEVASVIDFTSDHDGDQPISCSCYGIADGSSATYSGTANGLIERPSDIIYFLLDKYSSWTSDEYDVNQFLWLRYLFNDSRPFAVAINDFTEGINVIDRILKQCMCPRVQEFGKISAAVLDFNGPIEHSISQNDLIGETVTIRKTPFEDLCNNFKFRYAPNIATGRYEKELLKNQDNNTTCQNSVTLHGREFPQKTVSLPDVHNDTTASYIADRYVTWFSFRRDLLTLRIPYYLGFPIRQGGVVGVTLSEGPNQWSDERFFVVAKNWLRGEINLELARIAR